MAIVFEGWLARNEQRNYPLHDGALRLSDGGVLLPNNILTDTHLSIPASAGRVVYVSSVGITPGLISLTFLATFENPLEVSSSSSSSSGAASVVPVAAVRVARPVVPYKNYAVESLYPGVMGWVSFGAGANNQDTLHALFSSANASWLCGRCVRQTRDLPVTGAGKYGLLTRLKGLVLLNDSDNISITKAQRIVNGSERDVLVFSLKVPTGSTLQDVLRDFAAPCNKRPAEGNCTSRALVSINEVTPDSEGNINLVFEQGDEIISDVGDGMILDYPRGLSQICQPKTYDPYDPTNACETPVPSSSSSSSSSEPSSSSSDVPPGPSSSSGDFCNPLDVSLGTLQVISGTGLGTWEFAAGEGGSTRLITKSGEMLQHIVNTTYRFKMFNVNDEVVISATVRPTQTPSGEGHLIFGYKTANNFFFAGLTLRPSSSYPQGSFFIGRKASGGPSWPSGLGLGYNYLAGGRFLPTVPLIETDYALTVRVKKLSATTAQAQLYATWLDPVLGAQAFVSSIVPNLATDTEDFRVGMGAVYSPKTEFAGWCVSGGHMF